MIDLKIPINQMIGWLRDRKSKVTDVRVKINQPVTRFTIEIDADLPEGAAINLKGIYKMVSSVDCVDYDEDTGRRK